jgi:hypothetical protein
MASRLKATRTLEKLRQLVLDNQLLASKHMQSIRMIGRSCGVPNAYFKPATGEMVICYEMIEFLDLIEAEIRSTSVRVGIGGKLLAPAPDRNAPRQEGPPKKIEN